MAQKATNPSQVIFQARQLLYEWTTVKENQVRYPAAAPSLLGKWKPPVEGFECNIDATYNGATGEASVSMVVRNTAG